MTQHMLTASPEERLITTAARRLSGEQVCFVGIGLPSMAANLARVLQAPDITLVYESGAIGARPSTPPLSVADESIVDTALTMVSVPEMFAYWLQGGRIDMALLGGAQVDRFGNVNSTVLGEYAQPKLRLPGAGGATQIAAHAHETMLLLPHKHRNLVDKLDFTTTVGFGTGGGGGRGTLGLRGRGPRALVTDIGVLEPDPDTEEMILTQLHQDCAVEEAVEETGWPLKVSSSLQRIPEPTQAELQGLRSLVSGAT